MKKSVKIYPNPSHKILTFNLSGDFSQASIQVSDTRGAIVWNRLVETGESILRWDHRMLPTGLYFYRIIQDGRSHKDGKIVLQR